MARASLRPPASGPFRDYEQSERSGVESLYRENHERQTLAFARAKRAEFLRLDRARMGVWEALERLDALVDASDPDTELSQLDHALQTAEALRAADQPEWLVVTGLVHDLGKVLCLFDEPQWAVVGDTYPLGCAFAPEIVHAAHFAANPNATDPRYRSREGVYEAGCGLDAVTMSWGHDEYLFHVLGERVPEEAAYVVRYHSFYAQHQHGAYDFLLDERDRRLMKWVKRFQPFDLYSKGHDAPSVEELRPIYEPLVSRWFPEPLSW